MSDRSRFVWPVLLFVALAAGILALVGMGGGDPVRVADEPLPPLPAVTLDGERLDAQYFGDRPWVIFVWLPG